MKTFVQHLDTPGGNMLICLLIVCLGAAFHRLGIPKAEDLITGGCGALFMAMRGTRAVQRVTTVEAPGVSFSEGPETPKP